ncbi:E3 SUMO-protein ligase ZBED1 [Drosophila ficusphila]|uniref:E3 SUMO-protein ligase ZBED1 n=1 Tax=Drosophila ficusphila TaxID=30025 RepID=UPI0007E7396C|nr:E3 SUMO-protein ligase ZBED1 [Drosophila ficusphila]
MSRSKIWRYYDKLDRNSARCQLCEKVIKTCGNTSNLMKHMKTHPQVDLYDDETVVIRGIYKRRDPDDFKRRMRKALPFKEDSSDFHSELVSKASKEAASFIELDSNGLTKVSSEGPVAVQSVGYAWFSQEETVSGETVSAEDIIEFEPKEEPEDLAGNSLHETQKVSVQEVDFEPKEEPGELVGKFILEAQNATPQEVVNINMVVPVARQRSLHQDVAIFICRDRQPLEILEGEGFKHLFKVLNPNYKLPSVAELKAIISREAQLQRSKLRKQLAGISTLSLSCSMHTRSEGQSWLELVAHFYDGRQRIFRTLSVQNLSNPLTSIHINDCMVRVCQLFDINKSKISCITTSSNRMLEDAVTLFLGEQHHVLCFADHLSSLLEAVVQRSEIHIMCEKVRPYVEAHLDSEDKSSHSKLKLDGIKSFITTYEMLEPYLKHTSTSLDDPLPLSQEEVELSLQLLDVLRPLTSSIRELSRTPYPLASNALPIAHTLINELKQERKMEQQVTQELRLFMMRQMEEHIAGMERNFNLAMATLLDPRFRNIPFQSGVLVAKYMTQLYDMMQAYTESERLVTVEHPVNNDCFDIWAAYKAFSNGKQRLLNENNGLDTEDEIASYFCSGISSLQADPFQLWQDLSAPHPFLHTAAQKYLHIPATAMSPSRLFTDDGALVTEKYAVLLDRNMEDVLFMADVPQDEWQL